MVAPASGYTLTAAHAQGLVAAASDLTYVYRQTKPSAPKAARLSKVTLASTEQDAAAVKDGLIQQGQGVAAGVALARECANLPGNHCTPPTWGKKPSDWPSEFKTCKPRCWSVPPSPNWAWPRSCR